VLIARALRPRHAVVVHPSFTSPEVALRHAGARVHRLLLPAALPARARRGAGDADLVVVGNPTNPTGVLHPRRAVEALRPAQPDGRRGRGVHGLRGGGGRIDRPATARPSSYGV
jgi:histidinol-phosphate aminotransferase